jgi:hypothetical protein
LSEPAGTVGDLFYVLVAAKMSGMRPPILKMEVMLTLTRNENWSRGQLYDTHIIPKKM